MLGNPMETHSQACCATRMLFGPFCHGPSALQAYETLAILEGTSSLAQQALLAGGLTGGAKLKQQDTHNLSVYFNKVGRDLWAQGRTLRAAHSTVTVGPLSLGTGHLEPAAVLRPPDWLLRAGPERVCDRQAPVLGVCCVAEQARLQRCRSRTRWASLRSACGA